MKLSEAVKQGRAQPAPRPSQQAHGVRDVGFLPAGNYKRDDVREVVRQLRDGIPDAGQEVDELGVGLCGLLAGGRFPHCEAEMCYPSPQAMRAKSFAIRAHATAAPTSGSNVFPAGCTTDDPHEEYDVARVNARIQHAVDAASAAQAEYDRQQQPAVAAEAVQELFAAMRDVDGEDQAALQAQVADLDQRLRERGL